MKNSTAKPLGLAIFDLDGTLVDTSGDIAVAANTLRTLVGMPPLSLSEVLSFVGRGATYLVRNVLELDEGSDELPQWVTRYQEYYAERQGEHSALYPGVLRSLEELSEDLELYVLSNKPHPAVVAELAIHGIANFFKAAMGAGVVSALKPSPVGVRLALELSGMPPRRAVMVGDSPQDMAAGRAASTSVIHVQWGYGKLEVNDPLPDAAIADSERLASTVYDVLIGPGRPA